MFSVIDDEWNEVLLINVNLKDLACLADTDQTCLAKGFSGYENQGVRKFLSVKKNWIGYFINVEIAELCDNEDNSELLNCLHEDWEIALYIRRHLNVDASLELLTVRSWVSYLHEVNFLGSFSSLLFTEAENAILVTLNIRERHISEASCVSL